MGRNYQVKKKNKLSCNMSDSERQAINWAELRTHLLAPVGGRELRRHHNFTTLHVQKLNTKTTEAAQAGCFHAK